MGMVLSELLTAQRWLLPCPKIFLHVNTLHPRICALPCVRSVYTPEVLENIYSETGFSPTGLFFSPYKSMMLIIDAQKLK